MEPQEPGRLLIVDDESALMQALRETLNGSGHQVQGFTSPGAALAAIRPGAFDLLLTDLQMPEIDGLELASRAHRIDPELGVIIMTGHGTVDTAVQAMQRGALDYILKPFRLNVLLSVIARALDLRRLRRENAQLLARERQHAAQLAAAYQDLEAFSYSVSHDLRAPLLFVKDFAQRLEDDFGERLGEEGRRIARIIRDGSRSLDQMVVGLLAFSRASRQELVTEPLQMQPIVQACIADARSAHPVAAGASAPQIHIGALPDAMADATVIRHVWSNLIGNAIKYSARREQPRVQINGHSDGAFSVYTVSDNGIGFDMRYADKLFGVFRRLHSSGDFPGTGVGLAIAQRVVKRHGGNIWAESEPDAGSRFSFTLPAVQADG